MLTVQLYCKLCVQCSDGSNVGLSDDFPQRDLNLNTCPQLMVLIWRFGKWGFSGGSESSGLGFENLKTWVNSSLFSPIHKIWLNFMYDISAQFNSLAQRYVVLPIIFIEIIMFFFLLYFGQLSTKALNKITKVCFCSSDLSYDFMCPFLYK